MMLDTDEIRAQFPILQQEVYPGVPLVYLDSTATSQKPGSVIRAMAAYYEASNANVHRGIHRLSEVATSAYEGARAKVARFINAPDPAQIIFVRNATEGINLVANAWARANLGPGDEILITEMEHHSNIVPWQIITEQTGATLRWLPFTRDGLLDLEQLSAYLTERTRLFAFTAMSNVFGTVNPTRELVARAKAVGAVTLVDGAQSVPHLPVDVLDLDCDFLVFSAHKMCGPTGAGVLYGKRDLLEAMPPFLGGGDMIRRVTLEGSSWNELPWKFEAGTPSIAEAIGLGAAVDFLTGIGMDRIHAHERFLTNYALEALSEISGLTLLGPPASFKGGVAAFTIQGMHAHDIAELLDKDGVAVRAGHHCAMPLHKRLGLSASARASFYLYTTRDEIDALVRSIGRAKKVFRL